jgi:hypothetical protein
MSTLTRKRPKANGGKSFSEQRRVVGGAALATEDENGQSYDRESKEAQANPHALIQLDIHEVFLRSGSLGFWRDVASREKPLAAKSRLAPRSQRSLSDAVGLGGEPSLR